MSSSARAAMRSRLRRTRLLALSSVVLVMVSAIATASRGVAAEANTTTPTSSSTDSSTLSPWMTCMRVNAVGDVCDVQSVCSRCVHTSGCAFDTVVRECVTLPDGGRAMYASSSNALLNRTNLHYCADKDPKCAACTVSSSNPFCEGSDGSCVCPSMCLALRSAQLSCYAMLQSNVMYISVAVLAVALPLLVWLHRFFTRSRRGGTVNDGNVRAELRRMRDQRRLELARQRQSRQRPTDALALQLDTWRSHRDEHRVEVDKVEPLKSCYVLMESDAAASRVPQAPSSSSGNAATSYDEGPILDDRLRREPVETVETGSQSPVATTEVSRGAATAL